VAPARIAVLALIVWAIYIFDRLLDARAGLDTPGRHALQERHWFHWRHRRVLAVLAGAAASGAAWMIGHRMAAPELRRDSLIGLATLAYFSGVHGREMPAWLGRAVRLAKSREVLVGLIFSAGCVLPALPSAQAGAMRVLGLLAAPAAAFAALAWLNVTAIGAWESRTNRPSDTGVRRIATGLSATCVGFAAIAGWREPRVALLLILAAASALLLAWLDAARETIDAVALRAAADLVLLTPVLLAIPMGLVR
jgi:hypothetical protein